MAIDRAAVPDGALAIDLAQHKAEPEAARAGLAILLAPHFGERGGRDQSAALVQHRPGEQPQVAAVRVQAAGRGRAQIPDRRCPAPAIERRHLRVSHRRRELAAREAARGHAERPEHQRRDCLLEGLAGHARDHLADHGNARVRIFGDAAGRRDQPGLVQAGDRIGLALRRRIEIVAARRLAHQAAAVSHQLAQRDRPAEGVLRAKIGQVARDRCVEVELALLDQPHDRDIGEQLANRSRAVERGGSRRRLAVGIHGAPGIRPDHPAAVDERDRERRHALVGKLGPGRLFDAGGDRAHIHRLAVRGERRGAQQRDRRGADHAPPRA